MASCNCAVHIICLSMFVRKTFLSCQIIWFKIICQIIKNLVKNYNFSLTCSYSCAFMYFFLIVHHIKIILFHFQSNKLSIPSRAHPMKRRRMKLKVFLTVIVMKTWLTRSSTEDLNKVTVIDQIKNKRRPVR